MKEIRFYSCADSGTFLADIGESTIPCVLDGLLLLEANTKDAALEKHVPVAMLNGSSLNIKVGEVDHPMLAEHYIEWIFIHTSMGGSYRKLLPGSSPAATFSLNSGEELLGVYAYCNLHGLWKANL